MATYVKVAGVWKEATSDSPSNGVCGYVKVNGVWRTVNQTYTRINGTWRSVCTAPGQQLAPVEQQICFRPNFCLNGTNGVISATTEPCYLSDGVTVGTRTAAYTCQTDPGCNTFTVPAGVCNKITATITQVSYEKGDCEFWGGISGCTNGYGKRITQKYDDNSVKVSYECCNPLLGNIKYYCTLRPYSTGQCLNELKNEDITGTVVAGQGEWVCEAAGIITYPSCKTTENCLNPKTTSTTYESCGWNNTGQRLVTNNTYQSWCAVTTDVVTGECVGATDPCAGTICGQGSGEEEYSTSSCASGTGVRYRCVTPQGCQDVYTFKRCTTYTAPTPPSSGGGPAPTLYQVTEICLSGFNIVASCNQYSTYNPVNPSGNGCYNELSTSGSYVPCPNTTPAPTGPQAPTGNCSTCLSTRDGYCTTSNGTPGSQTVCVTPIGCADIYGSCVETPGGCSSCIRNEQTSCTCPNGSPSTYNTCFTPGTCPNIISPCSCTSGGAGPNCSDCFYGSGTEACGNGGTRTYCITPVGCPDIYGTCVEPGVATTPTAPTASNPTGPTYTVTGPVTPVGNGVATQPTTDGGFVFTEPGAEPIYIAPIGPFKSVNINTMVRTTDGLVAAHDLKVGDKLLSADITGFPYDNLTTTNMDALSWSDTNLEFTLVETEIVSLRTSIAEWAVIIDSDIFSGQHYILVNRSGVASFVLSMNILKTDLIWSYKLEDWVRINTLEKIDVAHEVVSIDCEPYDIFFTDRMLTHDSSTLD